MSIFELKLYPFHVISLLSNWGRSQVVQVQPNVKMGYMVSQYFEISQTGKMRRDEVVSDPRIIDTRKRLFKLITLGLLKSAIRNASINQEHILTTTRSQEDVETLSDYLGLEDWRTNEVLVLAINNRENFDRMPAVGLEHTEQMYNPKSSLYARLKKWAG